MDKNQEEKNQQIQEFLGREFNWRFSAGEANFLMQVLALLVQENPAFVPNNQGGKEPLNYQSIRSIVLLNEKLNTQLQHFAAESSIMMGEVKAPTDRVQ